jgi:hypothetical protein
MKMNGMCVNSNPTGSTSCLDDLQHFCDKNNKNLDNQNNEYGFEVYIMALSLQPDTKKCHIKVVNVLKISQDKIKLAF